MPKIKKIIVSDRDIVNLNKYKVLRIGNYIIKIDNTFTIPQVRLFNEKA
jgi:hypothetical protein